MPCVLPDGSVTPTAKKVLSAATVANSAEELAKTAGVPIYRVRSSIRELLEAGFLEEKEGRYLTTQKGREKI
jgi:predicted transcriptional regulator